MTRLPSSALLLLTLLTFGTVSAQVADSLHVPEGKPGRMVVSTLLAPTVLIGSGIATMYDRGFYSSYDAYDCIQRHYPGFQTNIDTYLLLLPALSVYGLNLAGVKGEHRFFDRSIILLASVSLASITTGAIKNSMDVLRPDGSNYRSFPSSHTALAFVSATFLYEEYKDRSIWYGIAGYSVATASGVLRMMNNKHWMSDVLVGAGIGILTTKAMYLLFPIIKSRVSEHRAGNIDSARLSFFPYCVPDHFGVFMQYRIR
jgi:membrane-associated phospholipid phosphatase